MKIPYKTALTPEERMDFGVGFAPLKLVPTGQYLEIHEEIEPEIIFCCAQMKEAWDDTNGGFGFKDDFKNEHRTPQVWTLSNYDGDTKTNYIIKFCPFCAQAIELVEKLRVRKVFLERMVTRTDKIRDTIEVPI